MTSWTSTETLERLLHNPWFLVPAALIASGVGLFLLARTWEDLREGRRKGRFDRLSEYRALYEQGLMSEREFAAICDQMGASRPQPRPAQPVTLVDAVAPPPASLEPQSDQD